MRSKVVFLDRDGTINIDHGYVHRREDWEWTPSVIDALRQLQAAGFLLAVVSNQSGIGHGLYSEDDAQTLTAFMREELRMAGVTLAAVAYCPHRRDAGCACRKPGIGMARHVEAQLGSIDYAHSWTVGDKAADMQFGKNLGTHTALIRSQYWNDSQLEDMPDVIVDSLFEAVQHMRESA